MLHSIPSLCLRICVSNVCVYVYLSMWACIELEEGREEVWFNKSWCDSIWHCCIIERARPCSAVHRIVYVGYAPTGDLLFCRLLLRPWWTVTSECSGTIMVDDSSYRVSPMADSQLPLGDDHDCCCIPDSSYWSASIQWLRIRQFEHRRRLLSDMVWMSLHLVFH